MHARCTRILAGGLTIPADFRTRCRCTARPCQCLVGHHVWRVQPPAWNRVLARTVEHAPQHARWWVVAVCCSAMLHVVISTMDQVSHDDGRLVKALWSSLGRDALAPTLLLGTSDRWHAEGLPLPHQHNREGRTEGEKQSRPTFIRRACVKPPRYSLQQCCNNS